MGTGWSAADAANVKPGATVVVVGDGAVGLLGVLSAKQMGPGRIIAMSGHASRQKLAREFGGDGAINDRIDEAYTAKCKGSSYLKPMIGARARSATVKVMPRAAKT